MACYDLENRIRLLESLVIRAAPRVSRLEQDAGQLLQDLGMLSQAYDLLDGGGGGGGGGGCSSAWTITVTDRCSGSGIAGATVTATGPGTTVTATASGAGVALVTLDAAGTWTLAVSATNYHAGSTTLTAVCGTPGTLGVGLDSIYATALAVQVKGCASKVLAGATVELVSGGVTVATATTDSSGSATITNPGAAGSYTLRVSKARFVASTQSVTLTCGSTGTASATLTPASGYYATTVCADPLPATIHLNTPNGLLALAWDGSASWVGCLAATISGARSATGCSTAVSLTAPIRYAIGTNLTMVRSYPTCSNLGGKATDDAGGCSSYGAWPNVTSTTIAYDGGSLTCPGSGTFAATYTTSASSGGFYGTSTLTLSE